MPNLSAPIARSTSKREPTMNRAPAWNSFLLSKITLTFALIVFSFSCKGIKFSEDESYGQKLVSLRITAEEYGLLNGQLLSKKPARAEIRVAGSLKVNCNVAYAGRSSLDAYRKSYDLDFCDEKYEKRTHYRLSAQAIDKTLTRSFMGYEIFKTLDLLHPKAEPAVFYINNKYQGLYVFMETVDKEFFKARKIEIDELYKARFANAGFSQAFSSKIPEAFSYEGKGEDRFTLIEEIYKLVWLEENDAVFAQKIEAIVDIDSFLSYAAAAVFIDHWDGFDNNYFFAFHNDSRKLITIPWDLDRIWEKVDGDSPELLLQKNALLARLLKNAGYKKTFLEKLTKLSKKYSTEKLVAMMRKKEDATRDAYRADPILARYQTTAFNEFELSIKAWNIRVLEYLARNPI
ncbi:MAG: hypothetical protein EOP10_22105 [Proteobacteria bacterium]|nr:MAG: hypothetical protein EOP10_22105 [Pseudomonadota bacterium]